MGHVIMALDMINTDRFENAGLVIEIEHVSPQVWVIYDASQVAFEVPVVNHVEPN